jgi:dTDP-glucose pyrophosphorylase
MKAVILAAGKGTRMGELTRNRPKPLLQVGSCSAIEHVIRGLTSSGFSEVVIVTGYLGEQVRALLGDGSALGARIRYVQQDEQKGTAHALLIAREAVAGEDFLLCFADILTSASNYERLREVFYSEKCEIAAGCRRVDDPWRGAAVYVNDQNEVLQIVEKPPVGTSTTPWNHAGLYCFRNSIYMELEKVQPSSRGELEVTDAVATVIRSGRLVKLVEIEGYWKDLATAQDVAEANADLERFAAIP